MAFCRYTSPSPHGIPIVLESRRKLDPARCWYLLNALEIEPVPLETGRSVLLTPDRFKGWAPFVFVTPKDEKSLIVREIVQTNPGHNQYPVFALGKEDEIRCPTSDPVGIISVNVHNQAVMLHEVVLWVPTIQHAM
jgi:hypothetical protein